jgi:hypothetical protein
LADIESERWRRCCGTARFEVSTIQRILCLRRYQGRLAYLQAHHTPAADDAAAADSSPAPATSSELLPRAAAAAGGGGGGEGRCPVTPLLAPLGEDVPSDWTVEEPSGFIFLWACNTAWASFEAAQVRTIQHARRRRGGGCCYLISSTHQEASNDTTKTTTTTTTRSRRMAIIYIITSAHLEISRGSLFYPSPLSPCARLRIRRPHTHVWGGCGVADSRGAAG